MLCKIGLIFFLTLSHSIASAKPVDLETQRMGYEKQLVQLMWDYRTAVAEDEFLNNGHGYRASANPNVIPLEKKVSPIQAQARSLVRDILIQAAFIQNPDLGRAKNVTMHTVIFGGVPLSMTYIAAAIWPDLASVIWAVGVVSSASLAKFGIFAGRTYWDSAAALRWSGRILVNLKKDGVDLQALGADFPSVAKELLEHPPILKLENKAHPNPEVLSTVCSYYLTSPAPQALTLKGG